MLAAGFADPELDAQRSFRQVLNALARPGRVLTLECCPPAPAGIGPAAAAVLLTLADADTLVWTDADAAVAAWLRFHAGCPIAVAPGVAGFVHAVGPPPALAGLVAGTAAAPQLGATLLVEVASLDPGAGWLLTGPGIETGQRLAVGGVPHGFAAELAANHARYPVGVDVIFCSGHRIAALPRSTRVERR
jgi:alpha-D-ribose 1-methylphosphonate 5-triphosphate synthase subunit PhnH